MVLIQNIFVFGVTAYCLYLAVFFTKKNWIEVFFKMVSWIFVIMGVLIIYNTYLK